ncbi:mycothiol transferase [Streptomyces hirsutus]|uniref:mycothiol transferase n=1 Tax=Streptomyces hirsutus TaxID=35620 RepID=UPI00365D1DB4
MTAEPAPGPGFRRSLWRLSRLSRLSPLGKEGPAPSTRWVLVHMIEETGRRAGHTDILRERIDGSTGR